MLKKLKYIWQRIPVYCSQKFFPAEETMVRQIKLDDYKMLVFANETIGRQLMWNKCYEKSESRFLYDFIKSDDVCFDVGANIGYYSLLLGSKAKNGRVYAFEPNPICFHLLNCNVYLNEFTNVNVNSTALGEHNTKETFYVPEDSAFSSLRNVHDVNSFKNININVTTLDDFIKSQDINNVDFIKIDVEGSELMVLNGATDLLQNVTRRPRLIMLELADSHLKRFSCKAEDIINVLRGHGYECKVLRKGKLETFSAADLTTEYNFFFVST